MPLTAPNRFLGILYSLSLLATLSCGIVACEPEGYTPPVYDPDIDAGAIRTLLMTQQDDWNSGDIDGYMSAYLQSDSLRFASAGVYRYGWQSTLERYLTTYPNRGAMGTLEFSELDIDMLSNEYGLAFGAWNLEREGVYDDIGGLFTLVLIRTSEGWRIKFDHTSSRS